MTITGFNIENLKLINAILTIAFSVHVFFYVDLFKSQTVLLLPELSVLVFFTKADKIGFESKGHTNESKKLSCRRSSLFCWLVGLFFQSNWYR